MTTIRHGEPCGLRTRMRSAERGSKSVSFHVTGERWYEVTGLEGGVLHGFWLRCTTAVFVYITHSAVVSQFKNAIPRSRGRMMAGTRATPPKKVGGRSRPHLSLREGLEQAPFPLALHRVGSVLAVKGSLRRFAPWTAPGRSERRAAYEGKGGLWVRAVWTGRKEPFGHTRRLEPQPLGQAVTRRAVAQRRSREAA